MLYLKNPSSMFKKKKKAKKKSERKVKKQKKIEETQNDTALAKIQHINIPQELANWFAMHDRGVVITYQEVALNLRHLREIRNLPDKNKKILLTEVKDLIPKIRYFLEVNHNETIWQVKDQGFTLADDLKLNRYGLRTIHLMRKWNERAGRIVEVMKNRKTQHLMAEALRIEFNSEEKARKFFLQNTKGFSEAWQDFNKKAIEEEKKEDNK